MGNFEGLSSILISNICINPSFIPFYMMIFFINPYSIFIWSSGKNNMKRDVYEKIYSNKNRFEKFKIYFKYLTCIAISNSLDI